MTIYYRIETELCALCIREVELFTDHNEAMNRYNELLNTIESNDIAHLVDITFSIIER